MTTLMLNPTHQQDTEFVADQLQDQDYLLDCEMPAIIPLPVGHRVEEMPQTELPDDEPSTTQVELWESTIPMRPDFRPLNEDEAMVLTIWQERVPALLKEFKVESLDHLPISRAEAAVRTLDHLAAAWINQHGTHVARRILLAIGAAFGQILVEEHGFQWARYREDGLYAWAVRDPESGVKLWPMALAQQRMLDVDVTAFLEMIYYCVQDEIAERLAILESWDRAAA